MDLIILLVLIGLVVVFFKDFRSFIYGLGIIEIFFRIITFIKNNVGVAELSSLLDKYIPSSIIDIFGKYSQGLFYTILVWAFLASMICLEVYLVRYFFKRK